VLRGGAFADRLASASARGHGAITAISNCAQVGVISSDALREANDAYRDRVEPLLGAAAFLHRTADLVRRLIAATSVKADSQSANASDRRDIVEPARGVWTASRG
jgi:hypothetical protein